MAGGFFESPFFAIYFGFLLPASLVCIVNMYSLFPSYDNRRLLSTGFVTRLLFYTFLCTFPIVFFFVFINKMGVFLSSWAIQFFITTPISWLAWRQQKDKIMQLRGLQKDLEKSKANLQFLRSQINPHFLFNTLNTLYGMALQEGSEQTTKGIQKLGDMMRFMLHENNLDFIPMGREIEYLQNYISLQTLRTQASPNIVIEDNLHTQGCNHTIAPMLLVPLVENAFKHGISLVEKSWIKITLECGESQIRFTVVNSLHTKKASDPEQYSNGIGLKNVEERLKFLYQGRHQLHISKTEGEFFVQIIIQP
jgi:LytS/YehU family sensor histidine kinase